MNSGYINKAKGFKFVISVVSALGIVIIELIRTKFSKYSKKYFSQNVKCITPNEIKNIKNNQEIILTGKVKRIDEHIINKLRKENFINVYDLNYFNKNSHLYNDSGIMIKNKFSEFFPYNNVRVGGVEKLNYIWKTVENLYTQFPLGFLLLFKNEKSFRNAYLMYDDMISTFGKVKINPDLNKYYFEPIIVAQGNKNVINYYSKKNQKILDNVQLPFLITFGVCVVSSLFEFISDNFNIFCGTHLVNVNSYTIKSTKTASNYNENCKKCNKNYKNVIFLNCNHYVFCFQCYLAVDKKCPLCHIKIDENIKIITEYNKEEN